MLGPRITAWRVEDIRALLEGFTNEPLGLPEYTAPSACNYSRPEGMADLELRKPCWRDETPQGGPISGRRRSVQECKEPPIKLPGKKKANANARTGGKAKADT